MNDAIIDETQLVARAASMRESFDRSFAEPLAPDRAATTDFIALRTAGLAFALPLAEIAGLHAERKATRLPGSDPALIGVTAFRGAVLPLYRLATLLGEPGEAVPRWLVVAAAAPVALAFDLFEGHLRSAPTAVRPREAGAAERPFVQSYLATPHDVRPILHLPSLLDAIRLRRPVPSEER